VAVDVEPRGLTNCLLWNQQSPDTGSAGQEPASLQVQVAGTASGPGGSLLQETWLLAKLAQCVSQRSQSDKPLSLGRGEGGGENGRGKARGFILVEIPGQGSKQGEEFPRRQMQDTANDVWCAVSSQ
jgi:hypothetical protein